MDKLTSPHSRNAASCLREKVSARGKEGSLDRGRNIRNDGPQSTEQGPKFWFRFWFLTTSDPQMCHRIRYKVHRLEYKQIDY